MSAVDVVVAGLGGVGSATAAVLARRGLRVLGLDRFPPAHDQGASRGETRLVRTAYFEGAAYVPLLRRAVDLWDELGLLTRSGGLFRVRPGRGAAPRDDLGRGGLRLLGARLQAHARAGEVLADLVTSGATAHDLSLFDPLRATRG